MYLATKELEELISAARAVVTTYPREESFDEVCRLHRAINAWDNSQSDHIDHIAGEAGRKRKEALTK